MASTVACRGAALASLLKKLLAEAPSASSGAPGAACYVLRPSSVAAASRRPYNTEGAPLRQYDDEEESSGDSGREYYDANAATATADRRRAARDFAVPSFFSQDVLDPFGAPTSLGRLLALMEDATAAASAGTTGLSAAPRRGWWVAKEDDDAVYLKVPMPGLGKEHVKVWAEQNSLVIKGEGEKEPGEDDADAVPRYSRRFEVAADEFKMDKIKAEMKNGMLRVTLPKVKEEERKDVFQVKIE